MMRLSEAAVVVNGTLYGEDAVFDGVSKDTRDIRPGDLYVAIRGPRFDGHDFVDKAVAAGAAGALVQQKHDTALAQIEVDDTVKALGRLAAGWRQRFDGVLIGLTGSNGKTTVKEMCRHILQQHVGASRVLATEGNLNNDIGMPLSLLKLHERHRYAVIEMGANHVGEIETLTQIAQPDIAILNNAGPAHLEGFGSLGNVARAKAEIFSGLRAGGTAIINLDDAFAPLWLQQCRADKVLTFSASRQQADVYLQQQASGMQLCWRGESQPLSLAVPGEHNRMNALAATAACLATGLSLQQIAAALNGFENIGGRLRRQTLVNGVTLIDDSYNANPASVKAAIEVLAAQEGYCILVLGDMGELGKDAVALHADIGRYAKQAGIDRLLALGELSRHSAESFGEGGAFFDDRNELAAALLQAAVAGSVVLVKGSRMMRMESLAAVLIDAAGAASEVNGCC